MSLLSFAVKKDTTWMEQQFNIVQKKIFFNRIFLDAHLSDVRHQLYQMLFTSLPTNRHTTTTRPCYFLVLRDFICELLKWEDVQNMVLFSHRFLFAESLSLTLIKSSSHLKSSLNVLHLNQRLCTCNTFDVFFQDLMERHERLRLSYNMSASYLNKWTSTYRQSI